VCFRLLQLPFMHLRIAQSGQRLREGWMVSGMKRPIQLQTTAGNIYPAALKIHRLCGGRWFIKPCPLARTPAEVDLKFLTQNQLMIKLRHQVTPLRLRLRLGPKGFSCLPGELIKGFVPTRYALLHPIEWVEASHHAAQLSRHAFVLFGAFPGASVIGVGLFP
jgi:hypothetical protein